MSPVVAAGLLVCSFFSGGFSLRFDIHHELSCSDDFAQLQAGMMCVSTWNVLRNGLLRATQPAVGYALVQHQRETHFDTMKHAKKWLRKHDIRAVIGDSNLYLTDNHHHMLGMEMSEDKDMWDLRIRIYLECDLRGTGDDFWPRMQRENYLLLYTRPRNSPFQLPSLSDARNLPHDWHISSFTDDVWRALAGFASHIEDDGRGQRRTLWRDSMGPYCCGCYIKSCTSYMDFEWGYALNKFTTVDPSAWPSQHHAEEFKRKLKAIPYPFPVHSNSVDLSVWRDLAEDVLSLCHSPSLKGFPLPAEFPSDKLQGWSAGSVPEAPDCPLTQCASNEVDAITKDTAGKNYTFDEVMAHYDHKIKILEEAKIRAGRLLLKDRHELKAEETKFAPQSRACDSSFGLAAAVFVAFAFSA
eukprot:gnl/TRDRNA2_/TRDRNA2_153024_c0_seq5.p1 gnl/TRDRNA2_/TRDRNA2_153024_c0~~gnl/TRDRNA2_/TRDRNA2_153024_c0_seq5.p1  ORF type:complete len:412 (+),score=53.23 gnl/TRDRNA2_/TRDRNA2_153024_c0_seq5:27-1262(+)